MTKEEVIVWLRSSIDGYYKSAGITNVISEKQRQYAKAEALHYAIDLIKQIDQSPDAGQMVGEDVVQQEMFGESRQEFEYDRCGQTGQDLAKLARKAEDESK